jgi:hypothetical protein
LFSYKRIQNWLAQRSGVRRIGLYVYIYMACVYNIYDLQLYRPMCIRSKDVIYGVQTCIEREGIYIYILHAYISRYIAYEAVRTG